MASMIGSSRLAGALALALVATGALAQGHTLTRDDYARAERFLGTTTAPLVDHALQGVTWLDDGHFWYVDHDAKGDHYRVMDAATGKASDAFDHPRLAAA